MKVDPIKRALELRKSLINTSDDEKILVADFNDTLQGKDTSRVIDLMPNVSNGDLVFRTKVNVKEIDPFAAREYKTDFFDVGKHDDKEIEEFVRKREFDFPLWFKHHKDFSMKKVMDYNIPFALQVAGCNFHDGSSTGGCWYCFVDDCSNDGKLGNGKSYLGITETIDSMIFAREKIREMYKKENKEINPKVLRISGGEPTIVLDWVLNLWKEVEKRGLDFVGQLDSNLSTGVIVDSFERQGIFEPKTLEKLAEYPIKVLTALKGCDEINLQSNVQSLTTMENQRYSLLKFLRAGFDIFPQIYNPNPNSLKQYLEDMDGLIENFSLRVHLGPLKIYGPVKKRLSFEAQRLGINPERFIEQKKSEWDDNYKRGCEVMDSYLKKRYGIGYKEVTRSDVALKEILHHNNN